MNESVEDRLKQVIRNQEISQERTEALFHQVGQAFQEVISLEKQIIDLIKETPPAAKLVLTFGKPQPQSISK